MSGPSVKEIILETRKAIDRVVNSGTFNALLLSASCAHMVIIAMNTCHGKQGENDGLCGKVWMNCKALEGKDYYQAFDDPNQQCRLRLCLDSGCEQISKSFSDRPLYADILYQANFAMRWVYTGVTAARMWGSGLILREEGFFWSGWSFLDFIIVVSAWLNDPYQFGNLMFIMVLRGVKLLMESSSTLLIVPRVQLKAIGMGVFKVFLVFILLNFIMGFVSLLAMSLIGSKGDFHNRCAVPLRAEDGSFTYEPIVPEVACRMDHLWNANVKMCYGDVWSYDGVDFVPSKEAAGSSNISTTGCGGTCRKASFLRSEHLGLELNLQVQGVDKFNNSLSGDGVYCIGPDFEPIDKKSIPPKTIDGQPLEKYRPADTTNWPSFGNNDPRNFDNIGQSAIVLYTIFFRNSWTETIKPAAAVGGHAIVLAWILLMIFTSYYLLNITVSITCSHYSEATTAEAARMEAIKKMNEMPTFDDDIIEEEETTDDQDLGGLEDENIREKLLKQVDTDDYPWCGRGCDCFTFTGIKINDCCNFVGKSILNKYKFLKQPLKIDAACYACQRVLGTAFKTCCHRLIKMSIRLNFVAKHEPKEDDDDDEEQDDEKEQKGGIFSGSIVSRISVVCMIGVMVSQGLQNSQISLYKCECSESDIDQLLSFSTLQECTPQNTCLDDNGEVTNSMTCLYGRCLKNSPAGYPCYNPRYNHKLAMLSDWYTKTAADPDFVGLELDKRAILQPPAVEWQDSRNQWCGFGMILHFVLYGWAVIFLLELLVRYLGHQGFINFFTMRLYPVDKEEAENDRVSIGFKNPMNKKPISFQIYPFKSPDGKTEIRLNFRNIIDSLCILATSAGIVLTEITFSSEQALLSNVDYFEPTAAGFRMGNLPWIYKLLRLATLIRLAIRIPAIGQIPAVAVILRGFRGSEKVAMGVTFLILMIFFFALLGKELFDYGYSNLNKKFEALYDFSDISSSMLPLLEIMIGSGWYSYAKAGIASLGVSGFLYFSLFFFIVNFQFLRIFIAIIVQNFELSEKEKQDAQQLILFQNFEKLEQPGRRKEKADWTNWDNFSFNRHYNDLLRGAQVTLRKLEGYQRQLKNEGPNGFNEDNERELAGESDDDEDGKKKDAGDEDEGDKVLKQITMIKGRLTINPQDLKKNRSDEDDQQQSITERIREKLTTLVKSTSFNIFVMIVVIVSTVLAVYTTFDEDTGVPGLSDLISVILLGFFSAEMALKMMAYGLFTDSPAGYFKRGWCILDFVLVLLQIVDVLISAGVIDVGDSADIFKGFRAIRIARLLARLQNVGKQGGAKNPLKVILQALGASLPAIMILLVAVIFMMFVFALVGIDQYSGLLYRCVTENTLDLTETSCKTDSECFPGYSGQCLIDPDAGSAEGICTMDKMHCFGSKLVVPDEWVKGNWKSVVEDVGFKFMVPRNWQKTPLTFDDMGTALFTMFSLINRSGIRDMLLQILSVTERDKAPIQNNNPAAAVYIIVLIIVVGVFVSQVNVGLMMTNLRLKSGLAFHTKEQLVWPATRDAFDFMPTALLTPPLTESAIDAKTELHAFVRILLKLQLKFQRVRDSWKFDLLMMTTVAFNCSLLAILYFDMPGHLQVLYFWGGFACFVLYVFEFFIKTCADAAGYFLNPADQFDILLTILNALDLFVWPQYNVDLGLGSLRMFRLFRLFNRVEAFVRLVETIRKSFPQAVAAVVLTFMVIFISSAIATRMFTYVKEGEELDSSFNNFSNFLLSLIAMFRVSSGAGWGQVISDAAIERPDCTPKYWTPYFFKADESEAAALLQSFGQWRNSDMFPRPVSDCGLSIGAYTFFLIFIFINNYILLPTFVASIIASYFEANLREHSLISSRELVVFRDCWVEAGPSVQTTRGLPVSVMKFERNQDKQTQGKNPYTLDRFDALLSLLTLNQSRLGFSKVVDSAKYKAAVDRMKKRAGTAKEALIIPYKTMAVMLLSIAEKSRPVTIVDILRRDKAVAMLREQGQKPAPPKKKSKAGKQHAAIGIPHLEEWKDGAESKVKQQNLKEEDIVYSYNIYVVLDQLSRMDEPDMKLVPKEVEGLKKMVEENDEDLYIYFEEYVEKSGPVFQPSGDAWKALQRFAKKAKDVFARSSHNLVGKKTDGADGKKQEEAKKDDQVDLEGVSIEEDEEEEEEEEEEDADLGPASVGAHATKFQYGEVLTDAHGTLDLSNWEACATCGEPVDRKWDRCPNCGQKQNWPPKNAKA